MTAEELTQLQALLKKYEPKDKDAVVKALDTDVHEVYQQIHDVGHSAATQKGKDDLAALQTKLDKANQQVQELKDKAPDSATLRKEYEERERQLKEAHKTELQSKDSVIATERLDRARTDLAIQLNEDYGIDLEYGKLILTRRPEVESRLKFDDKGELQIMQAGKSIAIAGANRSEVLKHFAKELEPSVEKKWKNSRVRRGSNTGGGEGGDEGGDTNVYDKVRKDAEERAKAKANNDRANHPARKRLRLGTDDE